MGNVQDKGIFDRDSGRLKYGSRPKWMDELDEEAKERRKMGQKPVKQLIRIGEKLDLLKRY